MRRIGEIKLFKLSGAFMEFRNLKLLFFIEDGSDFKSYNINFKKLIFIISLILIGCLLLTGASTYVLIKVYRSYKISHLNRQNAVLISQLSSMESKVGYIKDQLKILEDFDNDLRMLTGLPKVDEDVWDVGVGGSSVNFKGSGLEDLPVPLNNQVTSVNVDLAQLEREIDLEFSSFSEIQTILEENKRKARTTPTIRPVEEGWLQSPFGKRIDPFEDIEKLHYGMDIASTKGTIVRAPADGEVIVVRDNDFKYGYGKYLIIDHGDGLKTLFGHLSTVIVKKNQKVKRRDPIGEVGRSGRATGYHLHYEVKRNGKAINPKYFFLDQ